ncbi:hypothetical protein BHM03_00034932 [Ensete ventricosum]|nr:hypothetical protein BHM03_00034932 [Ensete ventricosum]
MQFGTHLVRCELVEGIGSLLGWRKGVHQKKTETRRKIIEGSRKAYDAVGPRRDFARRFVEGIGKLAGNISRDHRKNTVGLTARMLEAAGLAGGLVFTQRRSVVDASVP